jgi:hypothetical protein
MKKNEKNAFHNLKKRIFLTAVCWLLLRLCILKMICRAWEGAPITF